MKKRIIYVLSVILTVVVLFSHIPVVTYANTENTDDSPFYNIACSYDSETNKIKLEYRMNSTAVKKYESLKVSVYRISAEERIDTVDFSKIEPKISDIAPSNRSVTEFLAEGLIDRFSGYVLVIKNTDGKYITSEVFYPKLACGKIDVDFKGVQTSDMYTAIYTNAGSVIVEVDGDSLESGSSGYLFKSGEKTYTFSSTCVEKTDQLMKIYNGAGKDVILRITPKSSTTKGYELQSSIYAYVSFLYSRYSDEKYGISGIILGDTEFTDGEASADEYASCLYAAARAVADLGGSCGFVVPVSDSYQEATAFIEAVSESPALRSGITFTAMVEGSQNPYGLTDETTIETLVKNNKEIISTDNYSEFKTFLYGLAERNKNVSASSIYYFIPNGALSAKTLKASYVYGYISLFFEGRISAYIVDTDGMDEDLIDTVRYIDTAEADKRIGFGDIKDIFGIRNWIDAVPKYSSSKLLSENIKDNKATKVLSAEVKGSSLYFDFSSYAGASEWDCGTGSDGISSGKNSLGKALVVKSYGDSNFILHKYKYTESFKYIDHIELELMLESETDKYTVTVDIGGDGFLYSYKSGTLNANKKEKLYIDVTDFTENYKVEYMALRIDRKNGNDAEDKLYIYSMNAKSTSYDSETLAELIESERERLRDSASKGNTDAPGRTKVIILIVAAVFITGIIMITISKKQKNGRKTTDD